MEGKYLNSTTPGKVWHISASKQKGGVVTGYAQEGELSEGWFRFVIFQDRHISVKTSAKRATEKALNEAVQGAVLKLVFDNLVTSDKYI